MVRPGEDDVMSKKMSPSLARKLLSKCDGNHSVIYPLIKDEITSYGYDCYELPFPEEFLFFEDDYLKYYLDIIDRDIPCKKVLDIGCQNGFQSYIFEDFEYTGIDCTKYKWFRDKGNYIRDFFWNVDLDLTDMIVISNMSLGYFNTWGRGITDEELAEKLSLCRWLYIATTPKLLSLLKPNFSECRYFEDSGFPRVFLGK